MNLRIEHLPNGLYRVYDYKSRMYALHNADGSYRCGDLHINPMIVRSMIATQG